MAIDVLQTKIKKTGSALMLDLTYSACSVPPIYIENSTDAAFAWCAYGKALMDTLKGQISAVKLKLSPFAIFGQSGIASLEQLAGYALSHGFYTVLEISDLASSDEANLAATTLWGESSSIPCDAILISGFYGSDIIKPFVDAVETQKKDLFVMVRSATKSSSEIQDLLSGSRMVHLAAADYVNRFSSSTVGKYGFSRIGICASATSGDSIRMIRTKYPNLFMIIDGLEYPGANAKNCSYGFNNLGHGAIINVRTSVTAAWKETDNEDVDFLACAADEVKKIQKKLDRYVTVL